MNVRNTIGTACALLAIGALTPAQAQHSAAKPAGVASSALSKQDQGYFDALAKANLGEVYAGKIGRDKAATSEVKKFAQHMVDDHGKMFEEQRALAKKKNVALPASAEEKNKDAMKKIERLAGADFDRAFMQQMVKDHEAAVKLAQEVAAKATDPELKAAAQKALPDIQQHLQSAQALAANTQAPAKVGMAK
jgi:putative membrane protein